MFNEIPGPDAYAQRMETLLSVHLNLHRHCSTLTTDQLLAMLVCLSPQRSRYWLSQYQVTALSSPSQRLELWRELLIRRWQLATLMLDRQSLRKFFCCSPLSGLVSAKEVACGLLWCPLCYGRCLRRSLQVFVQHCFSPPCCQMLRYTGDAFAVPDKRQAWADLLRDESAKLRAWMLSRRRASASAGFGVAHVAPQQDDKVVCQAVLVLNAEDVVGPWEDQFTWELDDLRQLDTVVGLLRYPDGWWQAPPEAVSAFRYPFWRTFSQFGKNRSVRRLKLARRLE